MKQSLLTFGLLILVSLSYIACNSSDQGKREGKDLGEKLEAIPADKTKNANSTKQNILFFGNSLTAAYGLDPSEGFVSLIQDKIDALGKNYRCVNAGLSGETTAGGNTRLSWVLKNNKPNIFVLELGGNDGLRGIDPNSSKANLAEIIQKVRAADPKTKILLAGMEAPPNMGKEYTDNFRAIYSGLAKEFEVKLIPFLLDGVGGITELNQRDGIHPNTAGNLIVTETIWKALESML